MTLDEFKILYPDYKIEKMTRKDLFRVAFQNFIYKGRFLKTWKNGRREKYPICCILWFLFVIPWVVMFNSFNKLLPSKVGYRQCIFCMVNQTS